MYENSVFQVWAVNPGQSLQEGSFRGTATLVDRRGYFVTASHILEYPKFINGIKEPFTQPYPGSLSVVHPKLKVEFEAREVLRRTTRAEPDVSILQGDGVAVLPSSVLPVDPMLQLPTGSEQVLMIGYPHDLPEVLRHRMDSLGQVTPGTVMVVQGSAFNGESGSLALTTEGTGLAVLKGYDENEPNRIHFTHLWAGRSRFAKLAPTTTIERILGDLAGGRLSRESSLPVTARALSNVDLIQIVEAISQDPGRYERGVSLIAEDFHSYLVCRGLVAYAFQFLTSRLPKLTNHMLLEGAKTAQAHYRLLVRAGAPIEELKPVLDGVAAMYGTFVTRRGLVEAKITGRLKSEVFSDLAWTQIEIAGLGMPVAPPEAVTKTIQAAIASDKTYWYPYLLAARHLATTGSVKDAARLTATAYDVARNHYASLLPITRSLEEFWSANLTAAIAEAAASGSSEAQPLRDELQNGFAAAKPITVEDAMAAIGAYGSPFWAENQRRSLRAVPLP